MTRLGTETARILARKKASHHSKKDTKGKETPKGKGQGQKGGKAAAPRLPKDTPTKKTATPKAEPKKTTEKRNREDAKALAPDDVPAVNATPPKTLKAQQQTVIPLPPACPNNTKPENDESPTLGAIMARMNGSLTADKLKWIPTQCPPNDTRCALGVKRAGAPMIHNGEQVHLMCAACGWSSHAFSLQGYYNHTNIPTDGTSTGNNC